MSKLDPLLPIHEIVAQLRARREHWRQHGAPLCRPAAPLPVDRPSRKALADVVEQLRGALFPLRLGPADLRADVEDFYVGHTLTSALGDLGVQIQLELRLQNRLAGAVESLRLASRAQALASHVGSALPTIRAQLDADILAAHQRDGADVAEVLRHHPGIHALIHHRFAHQLHRLGLPLIARLTAELAQRATGIQIHPGALIGAGVVIQQGTDVRIDEHARIGANCTLTGNLQIGDTLPAGTRLDADPPASARRAAPSRAEPRAAPPSGDELVDRFGMTVRRERERRGWSQEQLAWRAELNRSYLGEIERSAAMPSIASAAKLAHALGLPLAALFAECDPGDATLRDDDPAGLMAIGG